MLKRRFVGSYEANYYTEIAFMFLNVNFNKQKVYRIKLYIYTLNGNNISLIDTKKLLTRIYAQ